MQSALVNEIPVGALAMLSETFAVIGRENDQRLFEKAMAIEEGQKISHNPVFVSKFGRITSLAVAQARILRKVVG